MKINKRLGLMILVIFVSLYTLTMFSLVFYGTTEGTFLQLTGKQIGGLDVCLDQWIELEQIEDQTARVGVPYSLDINVSEDDFYSVLNFTDDTELFDIEGSTGQISFTPTSEQRGDYEINITVSNLQCNEYDDDMTFSLTVTKANRAPIINLTSNFTNLVQGKLFVYDISNNVSDPDDDELFFYDNTSLFNIDENSGQIAFIPTNDDVGNHSVKFIVSDTQAIDSQDIIFSIRNVNDAPVLEHIGAQTAYINHTFVLPISAYDIDAKDNLTFFSNTSWFFDQYGPNETVNTYVNWNLTLNFTNYSKWAGTYNINISVNDENETIDSEVISFTITFFNRPPNITSYYPLEKEFSLTKGDVQEFNITKEDPDGTIPSTNWLIDEVVVGYDDEFLWSTSGYEPGEYNVTARITDGEFYDSESWIVNLLAPPSTSTEEQSAGGGGGGAGPPSISCKEIWSCSDWSECSPLGIKTRQCKDLNECGTEFDKPNETVSCIYYENASCYDGILNQDEILVDCGGICERLYGLTCPTCSDGIQNQDEEGVDCGGPCPPCKEIREPATFDKLRFDFKEGLANINRYWLVWLIVSLFILSLFRFSKALGLHKIIVYYKIIRIRQLLKKTKVLMANGNEIKAKRVYLKAKIMYESLSNINKKRIKFD